MAKDPDMRYPSAIAMATAARHAVAEPQVTITAAAPGPDDAAGLTESAGRTGRQPTVCATTAGLLL